jgi:hypothetical protein
MPITVLLLIIGCGMPLEKVGTEEMQIGAGNAVSSSQRIPKVDLSRILEGLRSDDENVRESSRHDLIHLGDKEKNVTLEDGLRALRSASQPFPYKSPDPKELSECLVHIAAWIPRDEYIPVIEEVFENYSDKARTWALSILDDLDSRAAATAYMEIIRKHADAGRISELVVGSLGDKPRHADVFFPELLRYAKNPNLRTDIYRLCLAYCDAGLLSPTTLAPFSNQLLGDYQRLAARLSTAQQPKGISWVWDEKYQDDRSEGEVILDLMGYFTNDEMDRELRNALGFRDPGCSISPYRPC